MNRENMNETNTFNERMRARLALIEMKKLEAEFERLKKKRMVTITHEPVTNGYRISYRRIWNRW